MGFYLFHAMEVMVPSLKTTPESLVPKAELRTSMIVEGDFNAQYWINGVWETADNYLS
ncbi:hypothetical protein GPB2148_1276 [marine gamma proteobacterium HTCC2148]|nr:hypothetical protein GPB2148_1276 [marine gamma proteobacterium HTCC2148]